jgi:hypothetical protein
MCIPWYRYQWYRCVHSLLINIVYSVLRDVIRYPQLLVVLRDVTAPMEDLSRQRIPPSAYLEACLAERLGNDDATVTLNSATHMLRSW